jgi:hypothetical protein
MHFYCGCFPCVTISLTETPLKLRTEVTQYFSKDYTHLVQVIALKQTVNFLVKETKRTSHKFVCKCYDDFQLFRSASPRV